MSYRAIARFGNQDPVYKEKVWFTGSTALKKGMGVCYDLDYYTANSGEAVTDNWGRRGNVVAVPSTSNNLAFAGVTTQAYTAVTGGQAIEIFTPGSICEVAVGLATVINSTRLTCSVNSADAGRFTLQGLSGRGTALALQTKARATGGDITFSSIDGSATFATATLTKTGVGTACGYGDATIDPTEFVVVVLGGATAADGVTAITTQGEYPVLTAPTADTITIGTNIGTTAVTFYIIKNTYPTVRCLLEDGEESGLQEVLTPKNAAAIQSMVGGTTFLAGGLTLATDSTATLADGLVEGQKKAFAGLGTLTTQDWLLTVTSGLKTVGTALATIEIDAVTDQAVLEWHGNLGGGTSGLWRIIEGTATEA
jgi:hypothetical protein